MRKELREARHFINTKMGNARASCPTSSSLRINWGGIVMTNSGSAPRRVLCNKILTTVVKIASMVSLSPSVLCLVWSSLVTKECFSRSYKGSDRLGTRQCTTSLPLFRSTWVAPYNQNSYSNIQNSRFKVILLSAKVPFLSLVSRRRGWHSCVDFYQITVLSLGWASRPPMSPKLLLSARTPPLLRMAS